MELFHAHQQWKNRPADERFKTIREMHDAAVAYSKTAVEAETPLNTLRVETTENGSDIQLVGRSGAPAQLTHWSFGQMARAIEAPANYLRELPPTLAVQNINHGLKHASSNDANLLFHKNGGLLLRALTSDKYTRIWNWEVTQRLLEMESRGWVPATPDIRAFNGDETALYVSDHDMFAFVRFQDRTIEEPGSKGNMWRGAIFGNSEVGGGSIYAMQFLYREMCGNHIIWGAEKVNEARFSHVGSVHGRFHNLLLTVKRWADASPNGEESMIQTAMQTRIAATKEQVLDAIFRKRAQHGLSRKTIEAGYAAVNEAEDGDPNSVWGIVQGLTRHSQTTPYADERTAIDKGASKLLKIQF